MIRATGRSAPESTPIADLTAVPGLRLFDHTRIVVYVQWPRHCSAAAGV
jgi:hypothetical protein